MTPAVRARDLRKAFGGNQAVADVSLSIERGELVALVGPNGAGKSTLLNLLTGQHAPDRGTVELGSRDVTRLAPSHPARRTLVRSYQDAGIFPRLSALENVAVPAVARGVPRAEAEARAAETLATLGLGPVARERADRLSGGQRKLVDFARTLVVDAEIALLDEPTAGVHPSLADRLAELIRKRSETGTAHLLVSHDLPWAFGLCPRVLVLAAGSVLVEGRPEVVREDARVREAYLA
ncbi:MAG: ABC transporter ATP-binding protein [Thermoleophilia bacterium]|nr:ABC transporter ATP-binding protein [Thermoleophilia bacterium]